MIRVSNWLRVAVACAAAVVAASAAARAAIAPAPHATVGIADTSPSRRSSASLDRDGADANGFPRYLLTWSSGDTNGRTTISSAIRSVERFRVLDDGRAVLVGPTATARVSAIHVIQLETAKTLLVVDCYAPSLSPQSRFAAFVRIHPQSRAAARVADHTRFSAEYRIVDLEADGRTLKPLPVPMPAGEDAIAPAKRHALVTPIAWSDERHFHFGDRYAGATTRIDVTLDEAGVPALGRS